MKVLFAHKSMNMGGIERALLNLTNILVEKHDIDVLLLNDSFGQEKFNSKIKFINTNKIYRILNPQHNYSKEKQTIKGSFKRFVTNSGIRALMEKVFAKKKFVKTTYDIAVAFHGEDFLTCYQVANMVNAEKKYVFIHFDVRKTKIKKRVFKTYKKFDKIICVSNSCAEQFRQAYPELADKVDYLYNISDVEEIKRKSNEFEIAFQKENINIISVSRLSTEKAHVRSLKILKQLKEDGFKFCWHIVGDGDERQKIEKFINENNMMDYVKMYGNQTNPYPYIKAADLFYLGSIHEAAPMVYKEAEVLGVPVLTTNTTSAIELVGEKGFVCDNDEESIKLAFEQILKDEKLLKSRILEVKENLKTYKFDKEQIVEKFNRL